MNRILADALYQSSAAPGAASSTLGSRKWRVSVWEKAKPPTATVKLAFPTQGKADRSCLLPRERRSPTSLRRQRSARFRESGHLYLTLAPAQGEVISDQAPARSRVQRGCGPLRSTRSR